MISKNPKDILELCDSKYDKAKYLNEINSGNAGIVCVCLVTQSCLTLCDPTDSCPPGSSVHGVLQARILECVVMPSSRGSSQPRD